jgi:solute carrier family 25 (mitochondrial phosphate transporter), member 23/24/25/41
VNLTSLLFLQKDVYNNFLHAFVKILREEGPSELYRGLTPSLIGVVPYAATNYYAYNTLKKLYRKTFKQEEISNIATLLIGSTAGAISSTATFPLEVARKQMQVGAVGGRQVYKNVFHALYCIMEMEGIGGLYKGLGPSCIKLMPAAGISFMCYEACKKILVEDDEGSE